MTDNEIIQALPFLAKCCKDEYNDIRVDEVLLGAFGIINRQQADNERLKKLLEEADVNYNKCAKRFYKEGVKEFAERLTDRADLVKVNDFDSKYAISQDDIDNLVKEMVGDTE